MSTDPKPYNPGPARGARIDKQGDNWTLIVVRDLRHPPEKVWQAITDPDHLREWAPFDANANLGSTGAKVTLTTAGAPQPHAAETTIKRADPPHLLEYNWGGQDLRWQLEPTPTGTRLTLWHNIDRRYITWGAAGWHLCLDIMNFALEGTPIGRIVGPAAMQLEGWQQLVKEYTAQFAAE